MTNQPNRIAIAALVAWMTGVSLALAAPATTNELRWGEAVGGLQMAVSVEPRAGFIHCWIRNAETNEITYNRYLLGYFEDVGIEYNDGADWRRLARAASRFRGYKGVGPTLQDLERLPPLQVITNGSVSLFLWADARYGPWIATTNGGLVGLTRELRTDLPQPSSFGATFGVDIGDFEWPTGILAGATEIRVFQNLSGPGHDAPITIRSLPVRLEGRTIQEFLERLRHDKN
ncbi:MAG: hypothetical protein HY343_10270 [Lentisphaerae bacterium]|nr:hypothetical protein [Lentisphaerota bacterium]